MKSKWPNWIGVVCILFAAGVAGAAEPKPNLLGIDGDSQPRPAFDAVHRVAQEPPTVSHDLTPLQDATRVLINPHKGGGNK